MRISLLATLIAVSVTALPAAAEPDLAKQAKPLIKQFAGKLKGELQSAIKSGGPIAGIETCNEKAPAIAAQVSSKGWTVGRTSLKARNEGNIPDAWELSVLEEFETRKAAGEAIDTLTAETTVTENGQKIYRFMKAIPTGKLCTTCHGTAIAEPIATKLSELYPHDQARGFSEGDIRGAFTLKKAL